MKRRNTKQRDIVLSALMALYHPTADEIYEEVTRSNPGIGRATVFRNLSVLEQEGHAVRLNFPGEGARYDPVVDGHAHFICENCGRILDFPVPKDHFLPPSTDCIIKACSVTYRGTCRECYTNQN